MKTVLTLLLLLTALPAEVGRVRIHGGHGLVLEERGGRTVLHLPGGSVPLGRGGPCDPCALESARLVGERPGAALILLVTYRSRPDTPGGMCGAGEEEVLNVVTLRPRSREAAPVPGGPEQRGRELAQECGRSWQAGPGTSREFPASESSDRCCKVR